MRILFATDGSKHSEGAALFLARLPLSTDDEITVLHVVSWVPFNYGTESYFERLKEIRKEIAPRILDSVLDILKPLGARVSTGIKDGAPERYIVDVARDSGVDMIVMGARGIKGLKTLIVGSVTKEVALNSGIPVLVTKLPVADDAPMRILYATDGSDSSLATAKFLAAFPFPGGTEVTVLNTVWSDFQDIPERYVMEVDDRIKEIMGARRSGEIDESQKILKEAVKVLEGSFGTVKEASRIGDPSVEILKAAESSRTDIIAVGSSGKRGVKGMLGSVSRNVLNHASCSVLIGRPSRQ